jgi:biotin-dependent carboxylase-like uncharacterized protein
MTAATLHIIACGPGATLQDFGRYGLQRYGVSPAGSMDQDSLAAANTLVGNRVDLAGVEFALAGATFLTEGGPALVAAVGAALSISGRRIPALTSATAAPGETITVGPPHDGVYAYLAAAGGFALVSELGSLSRHRRSGIGAAALAPGMALPLAEGALPSPMRLETLERDDGPIRIMLGPQAGHFTEAAIVALTTSAFTVSTAADRMGVRLEGPVLAHAGGFNIVSDGIATGSIQVPGDGRPIVLMRDRQTTGGYPKIATIITADLSRFAQLQPGRELRFASVSREEAVAAARRTQARIAGLQAAMMPAAVALTTETLLRENLIGGVTAG